MEKFGIQQLISSALMTASLVFVLSALWMMRKMDNVNRQRRDQTIFDFEKTTALIESGVFRHARHPMYSSPMFLAWGILLKHVEVALLVFTLVTTCACILAACVEEKENTPYFGET